MQYITTGSQFQIYMGTIFNRDILSDSAGMSNVRGKEKLVYEYINKMGACIQQPMRFDAYGNPSGLYADYSVFKDYFVKYWRRALDIARTDKQQLEEILDEAVIKQEQSKKLNNTISIYFEDGNALTAEGCLNAIYDVFEIV